MSEDYGRCSECGRTRERRSCSGHASGSYRRAGRRITRYVCRDCCTSRLNTVLLLQADGRVSPLNEHAYEWERAVRAFGIEIPSGTLLDRMTDRREP